MKEPGCDKTRSYLCSPRTRNSNDSINSNTGSSEVHLNNCLVLMTIKGKERRRKRTNEAGSRLGLTSINDWNLVSFNPNFAVDSILH
jgi:hypothetical protein